MSDNPKDQTCVDKVQLGLMPAAGRIYGALAAMDGAAKYGPYNWRDEKICYMNYLDAIEGHILALRDGHDHADDSGLHHLCHIIQTAAILADALEGGFLIDDRPAAGPVRDRLISSSKMAMDDACRRCPNIGHKHPS